MGTGGGDGTTIGTVPSLGPGIRPGTIDGGAIGSIGDNLKWWVTESVLPGPYGQPLSDQGPNGPTGWGDPIGQTERAGVAGSGVKELR